MSEYNSVEKSNLNNQQFILSKYIASFDYFDKYLTVLSYLHSLVFSEDKKDFILI